MAKSKSSPAGKGRTPVTPEALKRVQQRATKQFGDGPPKGHHTGVLQRQLAKQSQDKKS